MVFTDKVVTNDIIISLLNMHQSKQMLQMIFMTLVCSMYHSKTELDKCSKISNTFLFLFSNKLWQLITSVPKASYTFKGESSKFPKPEL